MTESDAADAQATAEIDSSAAASQTSEGKNPDESAPSGTSAEATPEPTTQATAAIARATKSPAGAAEPIETAGPTDHAGGASIQEATTTSDRRPFEPPASSKSPSRRPTKFLADLTRAMQVAAEAARTSTLSQLQADAKAFIEEVHARSANEAADLRKHADEDVAAIREWSKGEIARIREETEQKIGHRKGQLEEEVEHHAARIEREIERVQGKVAAFETEMERFFEGLLQEEDPTRFAALAQNLPEPPPFDAEDTPSEEAAGTEESAAETMAAAPATDDVPIGEFVAPDATAPEAPNAGGAEARQGIDSAGSTPEPAASAESTAAESTAAEAEAAAEAESAAETESAAADAEPAAETGPAGQASAEAGEWPVADLKSRATGGSGQAKRAASDPRLAVLGLSAEFDAAEAEAAAAARATATGNGDSDEVGDEIPVIGEASLSARLAGLVAARPPAPQAEPATVTTETTRVLVAGLASVSAIASFKRHVGRLTGVQSITVSSSPDGEFVFSVTHQSDISLRDAIPTLPGFGARVGRAENGVIAVTARDPETES